MTSEPAFETERAIVRGWRTDEADRFFDLYRRWEVARWLGAVPRAMQHRDEAVERITRWADLAAERPDEGRWAVQRKTDGVVAGTVLLVRLPDGDGEFEVGWHFHPDSWGQGLATETGRGAVDHAFRRGLHELFAVVRPDNERSLAVCRRMRMTPLGRTTRYYATELELFRIRAD